MRHPALLIDLDNTLYDYERAAAATRATVLAELAHALNADQATLAAAWDDARAAIPNAAVPNLGKPSAATGHALRCERFARVFFAHKAVNRAARKATLDPATWASRYGAVFVGAMEWAPGAESAFHALLARRRVMIVTEGYEDIARSVLERLGLGEVPLYATHGNGTTKRDGSAFAAALEELGIAPRQALVIGDNFTNDVLGSAHCGIASLWVTLGRELPAHAPPTLFGTAESFAAAATLQDGWVLGDALPPLPAMPDDPPLGALIDTAHPPERKDPAYARALAHCSPSAAQQEVVARLEIIALAALEQALIGDSALTAQPGFRQLDIKRIASIGSTTRHTAVDAAPDLDLLVETAAPVAAYPTAAIESALRGVASALAASDDFAEWCAAAMLAPDTAEVQLESFGKRGANTLVARFNAHEGHASRALLDITLTPSPRPGDYHDWMQAHLNAHAPADAARLCAEIRLAKCTLRAVHGVYGSRARGLRPITVEQWVLQVPRHRPSGLAVGSFDAVMGLVHAYRALPFREFRARFPVWRPGAPGTTALDAAGAATDLLGLLADGNATQAETRWLKVVALASAYSLHHAEHQDWTPRSLAASISDHEVTP